MASFHDIMLISQPETYIAHPSQAYVATQSGLLSHILLSVPHAGRYYPAELIEQALVPLSDLRRLEDPLVDLIPNKAHLQAHGINIIVAQYARAWIDLNRRLTEIDPQSIVPHPPAHIDHRSPRVLAGYGLIPQNCGNKRWIYTQPLPVAALLDRISQSYHPYHQAVAEHLSQIRNLTGAALLIDLHSMPSLPALHHADVVISNRNGQTAPMWLMRFIDEWLTRHGLKVAINEPYRGGYGVERHGHPLASIFAVQIELDRALYLDSSGFALSANAASISELITLLAIQLHNILADMSKSNLAAE